LIIEFNSEWSIHMYGLSGDAMTVIAALKANDKIYMGCDSAFLELNSLDRTKRAQSKILVKDEMIIGLTTNGCRIFQILQYKLKLPSTRKVKTEDLTEYMVVHFCPKLKSILHKEDMLQEDTDRKNSDPSISPAGFLIGIRNKLYEITEDFDVAEVDMPFMAIGGAGDYTMGSLEATTGLTTQLDPEHHLIYALKTAEKYNAGVNGPFQLINTGDLCLSQHS